MLVHKVVKRKKANFDGGMSRPPRGSLVRDPAVGGRGGHGTAAAAVTISHRLEIKMSLPWNSVFIKTNFYEYQ